ncbi:MAG: hypothetical protein ABEJ83_02315 [Candidatus Nanohaloarchaea archaeon]
MERPVLVLLVGLVVVSSGCVGDNVSEDSIAGQVLDLFGNFSSEGNSSSYSFSLDSITDTALMEPIQNVANSFRENITSGEGVEMKKMNIKVLEVSTDRAKVLIDYTIVGNGTETIDQNVTLTFVRRNGQWVLQNPVKDNLDTSRLYQNPRN